MFNERLVLSVLTITKSETMPHVAKYVLAFSKISGPFVTFSTLSHHKLMVPIDMLANFISFQTFEILIATSPPSSKKEKMLTGFP